MRAHPQAVGVGALSHVVVHTLERNTLSLQAAANAKQNLGLRKSKLVVSECYANEGPVLKRFQPRAKGRAYRINKYLTHITIKVKERA